MSIQELGLREDKKLLDTLGKMKFPNDNILHTLGYIRSNTVDPFISIVHVYNYGRMMGIRSERDMRKWNAMACFYNMKHYINTHNGEMPKDYASLMQWMREMHHEEEKSNEI